MPSRSIRHPNAPTATAAPGATLTTHQLCHAAQVSRGVLRLYEREGLLPAPPRTRAGYRSYPPSDVERLTAIRQLKEVGFTLREIALLLSARAQGDLDADRLRELAGDQLAVIDARVARLTLVRHYVAAVASGNAQQITDPDCRFLFEFLSVDRRAAALGRSAQGAMSGSARSARTAP